ncbi:hypothetical protein OAG71_01665 [bacterium]|nr:hypothetical protein [bacterium]
MNEPHERPIPSTKNITFNEEVGTANIADEIDNSKGKIDNRGATIYGEQKNMTSASETIYQDKVKELFEEMAKNAPELTPEEIDQLVPMVDAQIEGAIDPVTMCPEEFDGLGPETFDANEDHPSVLKAIMQHYLEMGITPTQEEQKSFFQRFFSCVTKYGQSDAVKSVACTVAELTELVSDNMPLHYKVVAFFCRKIAGVE